VKRGLVLLLLVLAGACSSTREPDAPPPRNGGQDGAKAPDKKAPPREQQTLELEHPGSTRAFIYTWREKFPKDLGFWQLAEASYVRTDDFANTWKLTYRAGERELRVAAAEHGTREGARSQIDDAERAIKARGAPLALEVPGAERACAGLVEGNAVAAVLSGRYLFSFGAPVASSIDAGTVREFVAACFAETKDQ
jgi:hypothetical protein